MAGLGITIGPVATGTVEADRVHIKEAIEAGGATVVAEHQPAIDIEIKAEAARHVRVQQGEGSVEGGAQLGAEAAHHGGKIGAVEGKAPIELAAFGEGKLIHVERWIATGRRGSFHQQLGGAAGAKAQGHLHKAVLAVGRLGGAGIVLGQQAQAQALGRPIAEQQQGAGLVAAIGIAEAGDRRIEIAGSEDAAVEQLAQGREGPGLGQLAVGRIALGTARFAGDEGLVPFAQGPLQQSVQAPVDTALGGAGQAGDQAVEVGGEGIGHPLVVGGGGDQHPPLAGRQLGEGQQRPAQRLAIGWQVLVGAAVEVVGALLLERDRRRAAPQQHVLAAGAQLNLRRLAAASRDEGIAERLTGAERQPGGAAIAAQLQITPGRQVRHPAALAAAQAAAGQVEHQGLGRAGLEAHRRGHHRPAVHHHHEAAGIEGAAGRIQARHHQLQPLATRGAGVAIEEGSEGVAAGIAQGGGIEPVHHQAGVGRQAGGQGQPQGAVGADGTIWMLEIGAAQQAWGRHHQRRIVAAVAGGGGGPRQQPQAQAEASLGEQAVHQAHEPFGAEHLGAEAIQLPHHLAQAIGHAGGGVAHLLRQPGGQRREGIQSGGEIAHQADEPIHEGEPLRRTAARVGEAG